MDLAFRATLDINVLHDRNPLFVTLSDGSIRNGYTVKILNKTAPSAQDAINLGVEGLDRRRPDRGRPGENEGAGCAILTAEPDSVATYRIYRPRAAPGEGPASTNPGHRPSCDRSGHGRERAATTPSSGDRER